MSDSFVHLHCHTSYSLLDGAAKIDDMVELADRYGMPAIATTDHGNTYSLIEFYKACNKAGVKGILGSELYLAEGSRLEKKKVAKKLDEQGDVSDRGQKLYYHMTALAENNEGYQNLLQISSDAFLEGHYFKPRTDFAVLEKYSKGIIATTGCLGGKVLQHLLHDEYEEAKETAGLMQDIFGKDNLFIELQDHGLPEQHRTNPQLVAIARSIGAPLLLVNDTHYCNKEDSDFHDTLLCTQTLSLKSETNRFKFSSDQHYIKTPFEMRTLNNEDWLREACDNTLLIAERCNVDIKFGEMHLPDFPLPWGYKKPIDYLRNLVMQGARERYADALPIVLERINYELDVIERMGFASYFLIVWDLVAYAKSAGIRTGGGRGSAAGSIVSYCLAITAVDPIKYGLLFERFLNPDRMAIDDVFKYELNEAEEILTHKRTLYAGYKTDQGDVSKWIINM